METNTDAPGVILVGHGSLRPNSGAAMIRLAARARSAGIAPLVLPGFLNYSRPSFPEALHRCVARGIRVAVVVPYFLIPGAFAAQALPRAVAAAQAAFPTLRIGLAACFGDHPALAELVHQRVAAASPTILGAALVLMAHGSPDPAANGPIYAVAERLRATGSFGAVTVAFLDLNAPAIPAAIAEFAQQGFQQIVAMPYFLQLGGHVAHDLPALIDQARLDHPTVDLVLTAHLGYDPLLVAVIADRVLAAVESK